MSEARDIIRERYERLLKDAKERTICVALLGGGGEGLSRRRRLRRALKRLGITGLIPEDDFPDDVSAPTVERLMLMQAEVELVFISLESVGAGAEFGELRSIPEIAPKLRILVGFSSHPVYGEAKGYLKQALLEHETRYGRVYGFDTAASTALADERRVACLLAYSHKRWVSSKLFNG